MRLGIVAFNGKVIVGPVKYGEAELAYKAKVREGVPGTYEIWSSDLAKRTKIKGATPEPEPAPQGKRK